MYPVNHKKYCSRKDPERKRFMKPTLVIMAAGIGSRYGGLKQIDPVGPSGEIVLDYSVYDAILISGRAFCYLSANEDVFRCLSRVFAHLKSDGILIFDNFYAPGIFGDFQESSEVKTTYQSRTYTRISKTNPNLETGWTWNWEAKYIVEEGGETQEFQDTTLLRAFTEDELRLFLNSCGFQVLESDEKIFEIWTVAQKKEPIKSVIKRMFPAEPRI